MNKTTCKLYPFCTSIIMQRVLHFIPVYVHLSNLCFSSGIFRNSLLYGLPAQSLNRLQRIVNTAARILCRIPKFGHISEILIDLHWLPVQQRVLFKVLILTYQAYQKTAPDYLCDLIIPYSNSCNLRSNNQLLLAPSQPRTKLKTYGERSFQYAAPNGWNKLPLIIRESPPLAIFKNTHPKKLFQST